MNFISSANFNHQTIKRQNETKGNIGSFIPDSARTRGEGSSSKTLKSCGKESPTGKGCLTHSDIEEHKQPPTSAGQPTPG